MAGEYPESVEMVADALGRLPGIGKRTAERLALALLDWDPTELQDLGRQLIELPDKVRPCRACGNLAEEELCRICRDPRRDTHLICIVESARQVPVIEKCARYKGLYHVLGGKISPLDGVAAKDLNLASLYGRVEALEVTEVILSTSPDVEGEATAAYIAEELRERFELTVSRIASGIPVGADLSYTDAATMAMAMDSRRTLL